MANPFTYLELHSTDANRVILLDPSGARIGVFEKAAAAER
jgi:hypothetical protein